MVSFPTLFFYSKVRRLLPVRSPLLGESHLMSFPRATEMFHFARFASYTSIRYLSYDRWVSPFRNLRITGYCRLPEAYRRLSRLSSPLTAKASTMCASLLDHTTPKGLWVMITISPMFTLDSVLFTLITTPWDNN